MQSKPQTVVGAHFLSTEQDLVRELRALAWPGGDSERHSEGEAAAERLARSVIEKWGASVQSPNTGRIDHYAALNALRLDGPDSALWQRYRALRRSEADFFSASCRISLTLTRAFKSLTTRQTRLRLPIPIAHPAQEVAHHLIHSTVSIVEARTLPGALDLVIAPNEHEAEVTIRYEGVVTPQTPERCAAEAGEPAKLPLPFAIPPAFGEAVEAVKFNAEPVERLRQVWRHFMDKWYCGSVYHYQLATRPGEWFDCVYGTWLFAWAAERLQVPARILSGLILNRFGPSPHYWLEVYAAGSWHPIDLYGWELGRGMPDWEERFFLRQECRLRFEQYPGAFGRFLPEKRWFVTQESSKLGSVIHYRSLESGQPLVTDRWELQSVDKTKAAESKVEGAGAERL